MLIPQHDQIMMMNICDSEFETSNKTSQINDLHVMNDEKSQLFFKVLLYFFKFSISLSK